MKNVLAMKNAGTLIDTINQQGIGQVLKPLIEEIHLLDTYVAGTTHLEDSSILEEVEAGDKLSLQREHNRFDEHAILLLSENGRKLGYIPEKDNLIFSRLMDAGKLLSATITSIEQKGTFKLIRVGVSLVDF